jgi:putative transposase
VSDITYWKIDSARHFYISLITDAYSHKIVGHLVSESLEALEVVKALQRALSAMGAERPLRHIHHSDRGLQYCSLIYVKLLQDYDIQISITENGDPRENAVAEHVNGFIKVEYLENYIVNNLNKAAQLLDAVID